jgi:hypothetical protein
MHTTHPTAGARIIPHTPEGHREIRHALAVLGTLGRDIEWAKAGVRTALSTYRHKQRVFARGWSGRGDGTLAFWRSNVREKVAALRDLNARLASV